MLIKTNYTPAKVPYADTYNTGNSPKFSTESPNEKKVTLEKEETTPDYNEKSFDIVGPNAPENVKKAWMEAAKEVGSNGLGMQQNGMIGHLSQMMVQRAENWHNGKTDVTDILGDSVESAIQAANQALFDLDNPLSSNSKRSIEVQQMLIQEREFYTKFLDKLAGML